MDFTNIRQLIYRERKSLDEFGILVDDKSKITPFLYDRLIHIDYLHPKHKYSNEEILRILNDVFFFHTLFFNDDNPLAHYADYQQISNPNNSSDNLSKNRQWVEMAIAYVILNRFNGVEWFREKISHARFFDFIKEEIEKHRRAYTYSMLTLGEAVAIEDKIINTITSDSESRHFVMIINEDFPLRDIQEVIDSKESLENCLLAGSDLCNYVIEVCKDEEQEKALIDRLLEPEKEHYGVFNSTICAAYRSLYELKSELTGEPLPEQLPFEKASICIPPMMATPPSILDYQKEKKADERDVTIAELRETISQMKTEFEQDKQEHSITQEQFDAIFPIHSNKSENSKVIEDDNSQPNLPEGQKITEDNAPLHAEIAELKKELGNKNQLLEDSQQRIKELEAQVEELQKKLLEDNNEPMWIDWLDNDVFASNINAEEIYKVLCKMPTPHLIDRPRCYVLYRVLSEIGALKGNAAQKDILKWWNAHFECGWHDDNQFKFTELPESIKSERDISHWNRCKGRNAEHYHAFAQDLIKELAWNMGRGEYEIKKIFQK